MVPRSSWIELVGVKDAVVPFLFRFESHYFFEEVNAVAFDFKNLFSPYSAVSLVYLCVASSAVLSVESVNEFAVLPQDGRIDHVVHFEDSSDDILAGIEVLNAGWTLELPPYEGSIKSEYKADP